MLQGTNRKFCAPKLLGRRWTNKLSPTIAFKAAKYGCLERLLGNETKFLQSLGADAKFVRDFRGRRRSILLAYLRDLAGDFCLIFDAALSLSVHSTTDKSFLVSKLIRSRLKFARLLCTLRFRLVLDDLGFLRLDQRSAMDFVRFAVLRTERAADYLARSAGQV